MVEIIDIASGNDQQFAIENDQFVVDLPINSMVIFHRYVTYQRVSCLSI